MTTSDHAPSPTEHVSMFVDGNIVHARRGQTIAVALLLAGQRTLRHTRNGGLPRGLYCGMGVCYDCIVQVDGVIERSCMRQVEQGIRVETLQRFRNPVEPK